MEDKKCEVHGNTLKPMTASISYGLSSRDDEFIEARNKLFPNSMRNILGGCVVEDIGSREVLACDECRQAETTWNEANRPVKNQKIGDICF